MAKRKTDTARQANIVRPDVTFPVLPGPNFPHGSQQTIPVHVRPDEYPSVRIVGITTSNPTKAVLLTPTATPGEYTITVPANTLLDNQVYVLVVWTTTESGSINLDTRPPG